jgi:thioredoxin 1
MTFVRNAHPINRICGKVKLFSTIRQRLRRLSQRTVVAVLSAGVFLFLMLNGCAGPKLVQIKDQPDFEQQVLQAKGAILVEFYKGGCPTCVALEPNLAKLAEEYKGRVTFARFELMTGYFAVKAPDLKDRYDISYFPTVLLFVDGQEKNRWVLTYNMDKYREVLNKTVGPVREAPF